MITFIFPQRLHRLAYFIRALIFDIIAGFLYSLGTTMNARIWWAAVIILTIYGMLFIVLPRIRDIGMSAWWVLAMLIPIADAVFSIILLFRAPMSLSEWPKSLQPPPGGASVSNPHLSPGVAEL